MNPFLERQSVRNDERRKRILRRIFINVQRVSLVLIVWSMVMGLIYGVYQMIFVKNLFVIKNVEIEGQFGHVTAEKIRILSNIKDGENIFGVRLDKVQESISKEPWIKEVAVSRKLPSTVWIYTSEYDPCAMIVKNDEVFLSDASGAAFKKVDGNDDKNLPFLTGDLDNEQIKKSLNVLSIFLDSALSDYFVPSEINFTAETGYSIVLGSSGPVVNLGYNDIEDKLLRFYSMLGAIGSYKTKIRYVDLNMPGKVVVKYEL